VAFGRHWRLLLGGFLEGYKEVDGVLIRFEDLIGQKTDLKMLADHISVRSIDSSVLDKKIDSPNYHKRRRKAFVLPHERFILWFIGRNVARKAAIETIN